jgi:hypothetical protein
LVRNLWSFSRGGNSASQFRQALVQVGDDIVWVLQADGQADQAVVDAGLV